MTFSEFYKRALLSYKKGDLEDSEIFIDTAIKFDNNNFRGPHLKAHIEKKRGNYAKSNYYFDQAIHLCKDEELKKKIKSQKQLLNNHHKIGVRQVSSDQSPLITIKSGFIHKKFLIIVGVLFFFNIIIFTPVSPTNM